MAEFHRAEARPHHQHDPGKSRDDSRPAPRADLFLEDDDRQQRDEERRQEDQRIDFRQRDRRQGIDAEHAGDQARERARMHGPRPLHAPEAAPLLAFRLEEEQEDGGKESGEKADLEDRQLAAEPLDDAVAPCVDGVRRQGQYYAALHVWGTSSGILDAGAWALTAE